MDPDRNRVAAAKRAGYALTSANPIAYYLWKLPKVQKAIEEGEKQIQKDTGITPARIMAELAKIGFANLQDYADMTEDGMSIRDIPRDKAAAIGEYSIESTEGRGVKTTRAKIKLSDKRAALIDMGKQIGMWKDQVELSGTINFAKLVEESFKDQNIIDAEIVEIPQIENSVND